jgi:sugar fermentation stimulation protein A
VPEPKDIAIGRLGTIHFLPGYYVYIGSALKNLASRIQRHLALTKKIHWHIDYLRQEAEIRNILLIHSKTRFECALADAIAAIADDHIPQFGASDCQCQTHLYHFRQHPITNRAFLQAVTRVRAFEIIVPCEGGLPFFEGKKSCQNEKTP